MGKFPLGKFELAKCSQVVRDLHDESSLEFRLSFHQGASSILLKATSIDKKIIWCDALKNSVDQVSSICGKCKPKLIVNPMPLQGGVVANNVLTNSPQHMQQNVVPGSGQIMTSPTQSSSEYFQQQEQQKEANYFVRNILEKGFLFFESEKMTYKISRMIYSHSLECVDISEGYHNIYFKFNIKRKVFLI